MIAAQAMRLEEHVAQLEVAAARIAALEREWGQDTSTPSKPPTFGFVVSQASTAILPHQPPPNGSEDASRRPHPTVQSARHRGYHQSQHPGG